MKKILYTLIGLGCGLGLTVYAANTVLNSRDIGASPSNGRVLQTDGQHSTWVATSTLGIGGSASPLTTKGDIYTYSSADARLGVGSNGQCLIASSTQPTGLVWGACASGSTGITTLNGQTGSTQTFSTTTTATGLNFNIVSSSNDHNFALSLQGGYTVPTSTLINNLNVFYTTPSNRITAGTNLSWSGNTLNGTMASSTIIAGSTATHSPSITIATTTDTNLGISVACAIATCTFTPQWIGTLDDTRITSAATWNAKVSNTYASSTFPSFTYASSTFPSFSYASSTFVTAGGTIGKAAYFTSATALSTGNFFNDGTVLGMNATSSTIGFNIQGTAGTNSIFNIASSTGTSILRVTSGSLIGIGTTTPSAMLHVVGASGGTTDLFSVASSTGTLGLKVLANGSYYSMAISSTTISTATYTIDASGGNVQSFVLSTSTTLTISNINAGLRGIFNIQQDGTGSRTITWPSSFHWPSGTAPTLTTTANKVDVITFECYSTAVCFAGSNLNYSP